LKNEHTVIDENKRAQIIANVMDELCREYKEQSQNGKFEFELMKFDSIGGYTKDPTTTGINGFTTDTTLQGILIKYEIDSRLINFDGKMISLSDKGKKECMDENKVKAWTRPFQSK
jgi:hypothetical protein